MFEEDKKLSGINLQIVFLILGVILGAIFANLFKDIYYSDFKDIINSNKFVENIDNDELFRYIIFRQFKSFFMLWIFSITMIGYLYISAFVLYKGFSIGIFIATLTMIYKIKGLYIYLMYICPHYIVYIPIYTIAIMKCIQIYKDVNKNGKKDKKKIFLNTIPIILTCIVFLILGAFLEAYINPKIINGYFP